ncbi:hypothetical protein B6S09_17620 [Oceanimonas baumannii]|uniref:Uncharacterized protein n=1 Tax=Oceanimonas baumannii TaxID=129578 RepID=A0A235C8X3_9GAMM|nr:hypothetical protein B6S09_17620 [Oceanimonas baumannii]
MSPSIVILKGPLFSIHASGTILLIFDQFLFYFKIQLQLGCRVQICAVSPEQRNIQCAVKAVLVLC